MNMRSNLKIVSVLGLLLMSALYSQAQRPVPYETESSGFDIGINVTSVISTFVGNESSLRATDLPVYLRWTKKNSAIRLGLGARGTTNEFFDGVTGVNRQTKQQEYSTRLGLEVNRPIDKRWQFYYGLDLVGNAVLGDTDVFTQDIFRVDQRVLEFGASPLIGFRYFVGERFYLSTEANMTYLHNITKTVQSFTDGLGIPRSNEMTTNGSNFTLNAPVFIYINYRLK